MGLNKYQDCFGGSLLCLYNRPRDPSIIVIIIISFFKAPILITAPKPLSPKICPLSPLILILEAMS